VRVRIERDEGERERTTIQEGPLPYTVLPGPSGPVMGRGEITPRTHFQAAS
jgi:hypothetical protein